MKSGRRLAAGLVLAAAAVQMSGKAIGFEAEAVVKSLLGSLATAWRRALTEPRARKRSPRASAAMPDDGAGRVRVAVVGTANGGACGH